jgi:hypothetical protein
MEDKTLGVLPANMLQAKLGETSLHVISYTFPRGGHTTVSDQKRLDAFRDGFVKSFKGKVLKEKKIELDGHPGRDLRIQPSTAAQLIRARVFVVKERRYQIYAKGPSETVSSQDVDEFLDSFKLR